MLLGGVLLATGVLTGAPAELAARDVEPPSVPSRASTTAVMAVPASPVLVDTTAVIIGGVRIRPGHRPLARAAVSLSSLDDADATWQRLSDREGRFAFPNLAAGTYRLVVEHVAFKEVERHVLLGAGDRLQVQIDMALDALELEPVVVVSQRRSVLERVGFHERQLGSTGHFLTAEDIQRRGVRRMSDLFRSVPGFQVHGGMGDQGHRLTGRGGCQPTLYVNGGRAVSSRDIDLFLSVEDLAGVEAYPGALAPGRYAGDRCGTILVWTEAQMDSGEEPLTWARGLAGAGLVLLWALQIF